MPPPAEVRNRACAAGNHYLSDMLPEIKAAMEGQNGLAAWNTTWIYGGYDGKVRGQGTGAVRSALSMHAVGQPALWTVPCASLDASARHPKLPII